jgi:predicted DNA binding CopG/RHH family protein
MKHKLDPEEQQIEREAASYRPVAKKKLQKVEGIIERAKKSRTVNIRIAENVLEELKRRSEREGIPYQTLISSILYKYVTDRFVDEEAS